MVSGQDNTLMSLKAFHIVFICASTVLALGFAVWEFNAYLTNSGFIALMIAILSLASACGLVLYGIRFMKKLKHVRMI